MNLISSVDHYELLDSGLGRKLEMISGHRVVRPSPQAIWKPRLKETEWLKFDSQCLRTKDGGGKWEHKREPDESYKFKYKIDEQTLIFKLKLTSFGHCGIFFEQIPVWEWLYQETKNLKQKLGRSPKVINLFGYTGAASIVMAAAGAEVFHVDSSKGVLDWGRESQAASKISKDSIKWIQEDAQAFLRHSFKKNFSYDGILADPPSWGHGAKKELWEFEKHIHILSELMISVLNRHNSFLFLSSHTHGVQPEALKNLLSDPRFKSIDCGDIVVKHQQDSRLLPAGIYAAAKSY